MKQPTPPPPSRGPISAWFFLNAFLVASWVAHVPRLKEDLHTSPGPLSLALLCMAFGSGIGMALAPGTIGRFGAGRAAWGSGVAFALLLPAPLLAGSVPGLGLALLAFGTAHGLMDVAMNTAAAAAERALGRPVMSFFHAWFSVGMVAGVLAAVGALAVGLSPAGHAGAVMALTAAGLLLSRPVSQGSAAVPLGAHPVLAAVANRRVVALAGLAFVCLFLEGAMADWAGLLAAAFGATPETAPLAYVAFTATWAAGRFVGDRLTQAAGDTALVGAGGLATAGGVAFGVAAGTPHAVAAGCAAAGLGLANAVPILFRAGAAADPAGRGAGLAVVTSVGYVGFLVGPPLIGWAAEVAGLPRAMLLVAAGGVLLAAGALWVARVRG
jgi:hypothetical protein